MRPNPRKRLPALGLLLGLLSHSAFFACHVEGPGEAKTVFTFTSLADSLQGADHATILLKDSTGAIVDTLFSGPVTRSTSFANLTAEDFRKGEVFLEIVGRKDSAVIYRSERRYNTETDQAGPAEVFHSPRASVRFLDPPFTLREGDSVSRPQVAVDPPTLSDKAYELITLNPELLVVTPGHVKGLKAGEATLLVRLASDTSKSARLPVTVASKDVLGRPIVSGPKGPVNTPTPTWTWTTGGGVGTGNYRYRLDNADMTAALATVDTFFTPATPLSEGRHTLYVQERDPSGTWSPIGSFALRIDTEAPPAPTVTVSPSSPTRETRPTWSWNGNPGDSAEYYRFKLYNDDFRTGGRDTTGTGYRPVSGLAPGSHVLYVQARDSAGNWSPSGSATVLIDTDGPAAPTVSVSAALTNDATPTWTWTRSGGGSGGFRYKLDDANLASGATETKDSSFTPVSNLSEGSHTLYVQERDAAGNWSPSGSGVLQIDLTPPTAPRLDSTPLSPLNSLRPKWTWRSGTGGARVYRARVDSASLEGAPERTDSSFTPSADLPEGRHILYVQEKDSAGNWSETSSRSIVLSIRKLIGPKDFIDLPGGRATLFTDAQDAPCIAPYGQSILRFDGTTWRSLELTSAPFPQIAMAKSTSGAIYAAGFRGKLGVSIKSWDGSKWNFVGDTAFLAYSKVRIVSIFASKTQNLYVAYSDSSQDYRAYVQYFDGNFWRFIGGPVGPTDIEALRIVLDENGHPILYTSRYLEAGTEIRIFRWNGSDWQLLPSPLLTGLKIASQTDVAFTASPTGTPYIALIDESANEGPTILKFQNEAWSVLGKRGIFPGRHFVNPDLSFDNRGTPYVASIDASARQEASIMKFDGDRWSYVGVPGITGSGVYNVEIAINSLGVPLVLFELDLSEKASVIQSSYDP